MIILAIFLTQFIGCKRNELLNDHKPTFTSVNEAINKIADLDWNTKLTDIPKIYPGGEMTRQKSKNRTLSYYEVNER